MKGAAFLALSALTVALPAAVAAQSIYSPTPTNSVPEAFGGSLADAIKATIRAHLDARGEGSQADYVIARMAERFKGCCGGGTNTNPTNWYQLLNVYARQFNWFPLRMFAGYATPIPEGACVGVFCNTEDSLIPATNGEGMWGDMNCESYAMTKPPVGGGFMVPSIPLGGGTALKPPSITYAESGAGNPFRHDHAMTQDAAALWSAHNRNMGLAPDRWMGWYKIEKKTGESLHTILGYKPPYIDPLTGEQRTHVLVNGSITSNDNQWGGVNGQSGPDGSEPCPSSDTGGGDFHFYSYPTPIRTEGNYDGQNGCTWYAPNYAISPTGYAYPLYAWVPFESQAVDALNRHPVVSSCRISEWTIRMLTDRLFALATSRSGYTGPDYMQIEPANVRIVGSTPNATSLSRAPVSEFGSATTAPTPPSEPVDTPSYPTTKPPGYKPPIYNPGGGDPGGNQQGQNPIDVSHPTVDEPDWTAPEIQMPDWLPSFSSLAVPAGTGECPTFGFQAFSEEYTLTTHCELIEEYKLLIASIMLVAFAFASYTIVLKA